MSSLAEFACRTCRSLPLSRCASWRSHFNIDLHSETESGRCYLLGQFVAHFMLANKIKWRLLKLSAIRGPGGGCYVNARLCLGHVEHRHRTPRGQRCSYPRTLTSSPKPDIVLTRDTDKFNTQRIRSGVAVQAVPNLSQPLSPTTQILSVPISSAPPRLAHLHNFSPPTFYIPSILHSGTISIADF